MFRNLNLGALGHRAALEDLLALAARGGWQGIDLPIADVERIAAERSPDAVADLLAGSGLRLGGWGLPLDWRRAYDHAALDQLGEQAALAQRLGCARVYTWVMPASDERPFRENFAHHVAQLGPIAHALADQGCRLGLEFIGPRTMRADHRYGFIYSLEGMLALAHAIGADVGLLVDSYHWYASLGAPCDIRALRAEDVVYVHINDAPAGVAVEAQLDQERRLPGATDVIDLPGFLGALHEIGYDGPVTPEPFDRSLADLSPDEASHTAHAHLLRVWRAAGLD